MPSNTRPTQLTESALHSTGAYELVFSALLLGFIGYGLDQWLGTGPYLVVGFSLFGFLGACASLYYRFRHQIQLLNEERG